MIDVGLDRLEATVNYAAVAEAVVQVITGPAVNLVETLAGRIADRCLGFDRVQSVTVTVHKPAAPVSQYVADLSVTINRSSHVERTL